MQVSLPVIVQVTVICFEGCGQPDPKNRYFCDPPPSSSIPDALAAGIRSDTFLLVDTSAIASLNDKPSDGSHIGIHPKPKTAHLVPGYINAVDASYDPSQPHEHDFRGVLKVHPVHIATTFYHRLLPKDGRGEDMDKEWWRYKQSWESMYHLAHGKNGRIHHIREGGVYPPMASHNF